MVLFDQQIYWEIIDAKLPIAVDDEESFAKVNESDPSRGQSFAGYFFFFYSVYEGIWGSCWLIFSNQIFSSWVNQMLAMTQYECSNAVFSMKIAFIIIISTSFMVNYDVFYFEKKKNQ